jgi:hypothetical protein
MVQEQTEGLLARIEPQQQMQLAAEYVIISKVDQQLAKAEAENIARPTSHSGHAAALVSGLRALFCKAL